MQVSFLVKRWSDDKSDDRADSSAVSLDQSIPLVSPEVRRKVGSTVRPKVGSTVRPNVGSTVRPMVGSTVRPKVGPTVRPNVGLTAIPEVRPETDQQSGVESLTVRLTSATGGLTGWLRPISDKAVRRLSVATSNHYSAT